MAYDLIIVGSGSVGAAASYYASKAGLKVLAIDSGHPPHDIGSHHGSTRIIRHAYGEGSDYVPLVRHAQKLWDELAQKTRKEVFHRAGVLNLGPKGTNFISNATASVERYSLPCKILTADEIHAKWSGIAMLEDYVGVYEPEAGYLLSENAVAAYVELAKDAGCTQLFGSPATEIKGTADGVEVVTADGQKHQAKKLVISAGTWAKKLLPSLPITPTRKIFSWHEAGETYREESGFPAFVVELPDGAHYYGFPAINKELKVGRHDGGQPIEAHEQRLPFGEFPEDSTEVSGFLRNILPGVGTPIRGAACTYDMSPDEDFIVDVLPENGNVMFITGLSGHGFKFTSALGEAAACFGTGKDFGIDLSRFSLKRFST